MGIKYFWGVKKDVGEVVAIVDLSDNERGLKCGCVCPICHTDFIARMGEIRTEHFAHRGRKRCDIEKANMTGLYRLVLESLSDHLLPLPTVGLRYNLTQDDEPITDLNAEKRIEVVSPFSSSIEGEPILPKPKRWKFESLEISFSANGYPDAIITTAKETKIALCIIPPPTVCKTIKATAYKDYPTVILNLSNMDYKQLSRQFIFKKVMTNPSFFFWIYYPIASSRYQEIYKQSKEKCEKIQAERQQQLEQAACRPIQSKRTNSSPHYRKLSRDSMTSELLRREKKLVLDDLRGVRYAVCDICGEIKIDERFKDLPIDSQFPNVGICNECANQGDKKS